MQFQLPAGTDTKDLMCHLRYDEWCAVGHESQSRRHSIHCRHHFSIPLEIELQNAAGEKIGNPQVPLMPSRRLQEGVPACKRSGEKVDHQISSRSELGDFLLHSKPPDNKIQMSILRLRFRHCDKFFSKASQSEPRLIITKHFR